MKTMQAHEIRDTAASVGAPERDPAGNIDIRFLGVSKHYGEIRAVDGVSFAVARGSFHSFLGPSGCGKTTSLRLIAGFEQPTEGQILLDGRDVAHTPPHKRNVNTVFQSYALFPFLTVEENVSFGLRYKDVAKGEARKK